jgi:periplasmic protein CpxP/Spy
MKQIFLKQSLSFALLVVIIFGAAIVAEAQRGQPMMDRQQGQAMGDRGPGNGMGPGMMGGPDMMGPMSMMCPQMMGGMMGGTGMGGMGMMGQGMGMMGPGGMGMMGLYQLDLTEEQMGQIRTIQRDARRQHMEIMLDMMDIRDDLMAAMAADRPDSEKVRELQKNISEKQGDMLESAIEIRNKIYDLLNEDQREQLKGFNRMQ